MEFVRAGDRRRPRRRRARGDPARVHPAPLRAAPRRRGWSACSPSASLFGLGHYVQGWSVVIITALLGMLWSVVYLARRSVVAPMVSHASFNLIEVIGFGLTDMRRQLAVLAARLRRHAAADHAAHLRLGRGAVLRLPAIALVRSRRLVRERVPAFLRRRHRAQPGVPRDVSSSGTTETGRRISFATIGTAILWSPFYAVADALVGVGLAGGGVRDGYGAALRRAPSRSARPSTAGSRSCCGWAMAHRLGLGRGALAAGARHRGSGRRCIFYMYVAPPMAHACSGLRGGRLPLRCGSSCASAGRSAAAWRWARWPR